ncbi:MAG: restriction endonuclease [Bacteroidetes bacterium]|nr:restriction endonuclease [Bacteroidota bacterium]
MLIRKASGESQEFDESKVRASLLNSGASIALADRVLERLLPLVGAGTTTRQIYSNAFSILRSERTKVAYRYKLKQAVLQLGDTGYPFERLIAEVFARQGFDAAVGQFVGGRCIQHEIDVLARRTGDVRYMECKYSTNRLKVLSIQTPLYVYARMLDVVSKHDPSGSESSGWLVTNMRFSADSIEYANCVGLKLLGWEYPEGAGLKTELDRLDIYPITLLHHLNKHQKARLIERDIVTCHQLGEQVSALEELHLSDSTRKQVKRELSIILG